MHLEAMQTAFYMLHTGIKGRLPDRTKPILSEQYPGLLVSGSNARVGLEALQDSQLLGAPPTRWNGGGDGSSTSNIGMCLQRLYT